MSLDLTKLIGVQRRQGKITAMCPICQENSRSHLVIFPDGKFSCIKDTSADHRSAIWALAGDGSPGEAPNDEVLPKVEVERTWPPEVLDRLVQDHTYWTKRGISEDVLVSLRGGVATIGQLAARYVLPIFNENEEIIGFTGRSLVNATPRHKHLGKVSSWIWGGLEEIRETRQAVLVEGVGCRLALATHGVPQSLCLFGVNLSEAVLGALIAANPQDIVIATNLDVKHSVGQQAAGKIKRTLDRFFDEGIVRIGLPLAKDFADMSPDQHAEWRRTVLLQEPAISAEISLDTNPKTETLSP